MKKYRALHKELGVDKLQPKVFRCSDGHRFAERTARSFMRCQGSLCKLRAYVDTSPEGTQALMQSMGLT